MADTYHRRMVMRKLILAAASAASMIATWATIACAQTYPSRTVNIVVPIAAGGAVDTTARIFAEQLQVKLGQPFVVETAPAPARPSAQATSPRPRPTDTRCS
jgi:tripartite-type tricarboxylate transporter receptor subunit TctC